MFIVLFRGSLALIDDAKLRLIFGLTKFFDHFFSFFYSLSCRIQCMMLNIIEIMLYDFFEEFFYCRACGIR